METVSFFTHSEVFKKINFIFAAAGCGGCGGGFGGGWIKEEVKFLAPIYALIVRNFFFSFRLKCVATYFLQDLCNN